MYREVPRNVDEIMRGEVIADPRRQRDDGDLSDIEYLVCLVDKSSSSWRVGLMLAIS
jgi:hypothetical protein